MKELSKIASAVRASTTLAIDAMFKQMKADGVDVAPESRTFLPRITSKRRESPRSGRILPVIRRRPVFRNCVRRSAPG